MEYRAAMRRHLEAIERAAAPAAITGVGRQAPGFLALRAALLEADRWIRSLEPPPDPPLGTQFAMTVVVLLMATEDVLRLFPEDPPNSPEAARLGELVGTLLPEMRDLLKDPGEALLN